MNISLVEIKEKLPKQVKLFFSNLANDQLTTKASALSYTTLLSIVPLSALVLSMFSLFPGFANWSEALKEFIYNNAVPAAGNVIQNNLEMFIEKAGTVRAVGLIAFIVTSLLLLSNIENTLNQVWNVKKGRKVLQRVAVYWTMLTLGPLFLGGGLALSSYIAANEAFQYVDNTVLSKIKILPLLFQMIAFLLMYILMPNRNVSLKYALTGAFFATILFALAQKVFIIWVSSFQSYTVIYGALAAIPIFLVWIYISWLVIIFGAEIAALPNRELDVSGKSSSEIEAEENEL